jgi:hypothetical protein
MKEQNKRPQRHKVITDLFRSYFAPRHNDFRRVGGWVRRWYRYHPLPEALGVRLAPHPAQAARRKFQVSDGTPVDWCSRVTFSRVGIELFLA